jgi:nicotinamide-nucleotide amidase
LPSPGRVRLRLTARGDNKATLQQAIDDNVEELSKLIGDIIVGYDEDETIEVIIGKKLTKKIKL